MRGSLRALLRFVWQTTMYAEVEREGTRAFESGGALERLVAEEPDGSRLEPRD